MTGSKVSGRLSESAAPEIISDITIPRLAAFEITFEFLGDVNKAHVIMLAERGLLSLGHATTLARGILAMEAAGAGAVSLDPSREDAYFNYEAHLMEKVGTDVGGRLHIGRSRNDLGATIDRLRGRVVILDLIEALLKLRTTVLDRANYYVDAIMPGYTHLQPAQPMTYGFYLAGVAQALERHTRRLADTIREMDFCPLGAAAFAGTPYAIDRARTAELLGFDGYMDNALDCVASRDFMLDSLANISLLAVLWSRVAQDFYVWATHEFGLIDFPDSVATASSIMPQKKNPVVLEYLKGKSGQFAGAFIEATMGIKGTNFSHSGEAGRVPLGAFWTACREADRCTRLFELVVRTAELKLPRALRRASEDFSTVTGLADLLVRDYGLSFRTAHHIVGTVVRQALQNGIRADLIDSHMVNSAAMAELGRQIGVNQDAVRACLDPTANVESRKSAGGPNPASVRIHLAAARERLAAEMASLSDRRGRWMRARNDLNIATQQLASDKADAIYGRRVS